jgi:hypothetical protein
MKGIGAMGSPAAMGTPMIGKIAGGCIGSPMATPDDACGRLRACSWLGSDGDWLAWFANDGARFGRRCVL